jgi:hypothetical protein
MMKKLFSKKNKGMNLSQYPYNTSLNSSSGYESVSNDTSLIESWCINPLSIATVRKEQSMDYDNNYRHKKRRVLSCSQREEANRRERHRMEIINQAYERLRNVLPFKKGRKRKIMSRIDTVDGAIEYIQSLLEILYGPNYNSEFTKI